MTPEADTPIPQSARGELRRSPRNLLNETILWIHLMEQEADLTQNSSLRHCLAYASTIAAGAAHAEATHLPKKSLDKSFSRYYAEESLGDPAATEFQQFGDILRIQFTASHIAKGWLKDHTNSRAAKTVAQNPNAPFRAHRKLLYEIFTEVRPHLSSMPPTTEGVVSISRFPPLIPNILQHLSGMVHQQEIDFETGQQLAKKEVDRAISEAEITTEEGVQLLKPWETSPSETPTVPKDEALQFAQRLREKLKALVEG